MEKSETPALNPFMVRYSAAMWEILFVIAHNQQAVNHTGHHREQLHPVQLGSHVVELLLYLCLVPD